METIFTVRGEHLGLLSADRAVDLFRELLWAEATTTGVGKNLVDVPAAITVADGGIDAEVVDAEPQGGQGIIKQGLTRYQIKTGRFSLSGNADINEILFRSGSSELKARVKSCLDAGGTLVIVLFGPDRPDTTDDEVRGRFLDALVATDERYSNAEIEIWRQYQLCGFLTRFPSLALRVTGRYASLFQSHQSWSLQDDMHAEYEEGEDQRVLLERLREEIRGANSALHARVWGEAGVGKTRLALEATRTEDLSPLVVYCDTASKFVNSVLMNELLKDDNTFSSILVIDECDPDARSQIWNKLKYRGNRIRLISLYSENDATSGDITYLNAPPLREDQVVSILKSYGLAENQARRWSEFCSGSPRVAHVLGLNLRNNPEDLLKPLDTVNVWERYIQGRDDPASVAVRQRTLVLRYISLFKRFGYDNPLTQEARAVAKLVQEADESITWPRFQETVKELRKRRILQGETTLYLTPKALHVWLWRDWWETYGNSFDYDSFSDRLPPPLLDWFMEMFQYAASSPLASRVAKELLGPAGPFTDENFLHTQRGADFFLRLSEGEPKAALAYLKKTIGAKDKRELIEFTDGRRQVVWALENIAVWRDLFCDAAMILLALAEAENELGIANNASGVFASLFSVGPGAVASTEAPPEERWPILEDAFRSSSAERRQLAISACDAALDTGQWFRMIGPENQGLRRGADLWAPKTYRELWDAYRHVWRVLTNALDELADDDQDRAIDVLLRAARGLSIIPSLSEMVTRDIRGLVTKPYSDRRKILEHVVQILHYEARELPEKARREFEQVRDELTGDDFGSLMRRYVGMDLLEDRFDEEGNRVDKVQPRVEELAQQSIDDVALLTDELGWLVTVEAKNGFRFGYELGLRDSAVKLLPEIKQAQEAAGSDSSLSFMGGYLRAYRGIDQESWEELADRFANNRQTRVWVPELTLMSGYMSDRSAKRVLGLARSGYTPLPQLGTFVLGGLIRNIDPEVFKDWIEYLLAQPDENAVATALDLYSTYYTGETVKGQVPKDLTLKLLTHDSLFRRGQRGQFKGDDYDWTTIGEVFLETHPELSLAVARKMLQCLGEDGTIVEGFHSRSRTLLNRIVSQFPNEVWPMVSDVLGPPIDGVAYCVKEWLRGEDMFEPGEAAMIEVFPPDLIWEWVNGDLDTRAWYLATFVPPTLFRDENKPCLARELLIRFGDRKDVRRNLLANFYSEGWTGPMSEHLEAKKAGLLQFRDSETDRNVLQWIDEHVDDLDNRIKQERIDEERRQP